MAGTTIADNLARYRIGEKVRALRQEKELGLVQLGEHTDLSPALLSRIERGRIVPTLPTLTRIALVFGVGLEHFFTDERPRPIRAVVRKAERLRLPDRPGEGAPAYLFESLDFPVSDRRMEAFLAEFPAGSGPAPAHRHAGAEIIYVVAGELSVMFEEEEVRLGEGDSLYFDSGHEHAYRRAGPAACQIVVAVTR